MKNEISALMDDELDPGSAGGCFQKLGQDAELVQTWREYHLIGDALRGELRPSFDERFAQRLAAEPTILAPKAMRNAANARWTTVLSAAAGVAAVAIAAWVAMPAGVNGDGALLAAKSGTPEAPVASSGPAQPVPVAVGVDDYLLAHQRFSPASGMQGVAPYVRTVSAERKSDR
jgi:sigma-E factor negative regulatory protein RseA